MQQKVSIAETVTWLLVPVPLWHCIKHLTHSWISNLEWNESVVIHNGIGDLPVSPHVEVSGYHCDNKCPHLCIFRDVSNITSRGDWENRSVVIGISNVDPDCNLCCIWRVCAHRILVLGTNIVSYYYFWSVSISASPAHLCVHIGREDQRIFLQPMWIY